MLYIPRTHIIGGTRKVQGIREIDKANYNPMCWALLDPVHCVQVLVDTVVGPM